MMVISYDMVKNTFGTRHQYVSGTLICGFQTVLHKPMLVVAYDNNKPTLSHFPVPLLFVKATQEEKKSIKLSLTR